MTWVLFLRSKLAVESSGATAINNEANNYLRWPEGLEELTIDSCYNDMYGARAHQTNTRAWACSGATSGHARRHRRSRIISDLLRVGGSRVEPSWVCAVPANAGIHLQIVIEWVSNDTMPGGLPSHPADS